MWDHHKVETLTFDKIPINRNISIDNAFVKKIAPKLREGKQELSEPELESNAQLSNHTVRTIEANYYWYSRAQSQSLTNT